jgi:hypothetical protein
MFAHGGFFVCAWCLFNHKVHKGENAQRSQSIDEYPTKNGDTYFSHITLCSL